MSKQSCFLSSITCLYYNFGYVAFFSGGPGKYLLAFKKVIMVCKHIIVSLHNRFGMDTDEVALRLDCHVMILAILGLNGLLYIKSKEALMETWYLKEMLYN